VRTTENGFHPVVENVCGFIVNATGEVVAFKRSKGETSAMLTGMLLEVKERCERLRITYPTVIFTDNAAAQEAYINRVFPDCKVGQDLKHLINRTLEFVTRTNNHYGAFCKDFHQAFTLSTKQLVTSRNGEKYYVNGRLDDPKTMINRVSTNT
jgi:hypothetical protein